MKPKCKLCGERHWTWEPHTFKGVMKSNGELENVAPIENVTSDREATESNPATKSKRGGSRPGAGRRRVYGSDTERKAAWRERQASWRDNEANGGPAGSADV